ncbi:MAG TPA: hypothetical protein GX741_00775 [Erysipelothrix sp.]|nr:hypothetical protein [Erysipelothrix sp.]
MNYSINTMVTGNKLIAVIKLVEATSKLFPFDATHDANCLPIANVENVQRIVSLFEKEGMDQIYIMGESISNHVRSALYSKEVGYINTMEELNEAFDFVLLVNGNEYFGSEDLTELLNNFKEQPTNYSMVKPLDRFNRAYENFGVKVKDDVIEKIYGHARDHYVDYLLGNVGIYSKNIFMNQESTSPGFKAIVSGGMPPQKLYFENVLNTSIERGESIRVDVAKQPLLTIDSPWTLFEANTHEAKHLTNQLKSNEGEYVTDGTCLIDGHLKVGKNVKIEKNVIIKGNCIIGDHVSISSGAIIEGGCVIGDHSIINDYAKLGKNTVIGASCKIGYNAELVGVFMEGVSAVHNCEMYGEIGRYVDIAAGCIAAILRFDDQVSQVTHEGKRYSSLFTNAVFMGDYTRCGINNTFYPGLRIGAYCALGPGAIVETDVPHNSLLQVSQPKELKPWHSGRYGWK